MATPFPTGTISACDVIAKWIDQELAAGKPPKWVAQMAATGNRYLAAMAREWENENVQQTEQ